MASMRSSSRLRRPSRIRSRTSARVSPKNARPVVTASKWQVRQSLFGSSVGRWRHYQKYLEPYLYLLEPFVKAFGYE